MLIVGGQGVPTVSDGCGFGQWWRQPAVRSMAPPDRESPANRCCQCCDSCCKRGPSRPVNLTGAESVLALRLLGIMPRKPFLRKTFGHRLSANVYLGARTDFVSSGSQSSSHVFWRHAFQSFVPTMVLRCIARAPFTFLIWETCVAHRRASSCLAANRGRRCLAVHVSANSIKQPNDRKDDGQLQQQDDGQLQQQAPW